MDKTIFEVTNDLLESGLRGVPVGYCNTSFIDKDKGLFYKSISIRTLSTWEPEKVIFLLLEGREGTAEEIRSFKKNLFKRGSCSQAVVKQIYALPRNANPMELLSAALIILGMVESSNNYEEDCFNLIAKIPHLAACVINHHAGWGNTPHVDNNLGYMENLAHIIKYPKAEIDRFSEVINMFNILHFDHGGGNLSTFTAKVIASSLSGMHGAVSGAMCALSGARHGKANRDFIEMISNFLDDCKGSISKNSVHIFVSKILAHKSKIPGFGHSVLSSEDTRATILYEFAEKNFPENPFVKSALLFRKEVPEILKSSTSIKNPFPNIDAISGALLHASGFCFPQYYTVLFGLSRMVGICIQVLYERTKANNGRGTPIIRPNYFYKTSE